MYLKYQKQGLGKPKVSPREAMALAVRHIETHTKRENKMSDQLPAVKSATSISLAEKFGYTESQLDLIRRKVAKKATDDELELFFYRAIELDANPLMPGEIFFVKFGDNPGTIIIGLDTFRNRAHATGKLAGVKRGVIRDKNGVCIGGWADVYRSDWKEPAHEEVALKEYSTGKANWAKMPETMIKKVAEVAAYRMAFPKQLSGLYSHDEMEKVTKEVESTVESKPEEKPQTVIKPVSNGPNTAQLGRLFTIANSKSVSNERVRELLLQWFNLTSTKELSIDQYNEFVKRLEDLPRIDKQKEIEVLEDEVPFEIQKSVSAAPAPVAPVEPSVELPWKKYLDPDMVI
jgi:phage recombination protein Bet